MSITGKRPSAQDGNQALQGAFNDVDSSLTVNGFLVGKIGHKVDMALSTTTITNDTETYTFSDSGTTLYAIKVIYTDGSRVTMISAERIS